MPVTAHDRRAYEFERLLEAERAATTRARTLAAINETLLSAVGPDEVLARLVGTVSEVAGADKCLVIEVSGPNYTITHVRNVRKVRDGLVGIAKDADFFPAFALAARAGSPVLIEDTWEDPRTNKDFVVPYELRAFQLIPLIVFDEAIGILALAYDAPRTFAPEDAEFCARMSVAMSLALRNARLLEAIRRQSELNRITAETAALLASTLDMGTVMDAVIESAAGALGASGGLLTVREPDGWRATASFGYAGEQFDAFVPDARAVTFQRVLETREPFFAPDTESDPLVDRELARRLRYRSFIAYPVRFRDRVAAILAFSFDEPQSRIGDDELGFLARIAYMIGVTEENTRLYQNEHRIAETLQEALLAMPERVDGVEFAHSYRSATEAERVGGDFYDVFQLSQGHVGITIGDVAGKGIEAAVLTSLAKNTIRAHATERGKTPAEILALTDDVVFRATPTESFVTVFFGILDCRDGHLSYANAGHTTAAIVRTDETVGRLRVTGPLLGAFANARFEQVETHLEPGETLFLYTDGLTESRRVRELYGEDRLFDLLSSKAGRSVDDLVSEVVETVFEFGGRVRRDDAAVLAVRRAAQGPEAPDQLKIAL